MQETPTQVVHGSEDEFHVARALEASDVALNAKRGSESGFEVAWIREIMRNSRERKKKKALAAIAVSANESRGSEE